MSHSQARAAGRGRRQHRATTRPAHRQDILVVAVLLIAANLRTALTSIGPLLETVRRDTGLSAGGAGFLVGALPLLTFAVVSPQGSALARRTGINRLLCGAMVLLAVGIVVRSLPVAALLRVGTILLSAAIAMGKVLLPGVVKERFPDRIGPMTGLYSATIGVVASVASGVAVPLAGSLAGGWHTALGLWAGVAILAVAVWLPQLAGPGPRLARTLRRGTSGGRQSGSIPGGPAWPGRSPRSSPCARGGSTR